MLKRILITCACSVLLTACSAPETNIEQPVQNSEITVPENSSSSSVKDSDVLEASHQYTHQETGFYSLVDEGNIKTVKSQLSGTCWVVAASTAMESAYKKAYGKDIIIDPMDILNLVLVTDKNEGYLAKEGTDVNDIGGDAWQITGTLSNGFGEYVLINTNDYMDASRADIQNAIKEIGALVVGINDSRYWREDGYKTLLAYKDDEMDHETTLIGWDNNFPRTYFKHDASEDGAFYAQNTRSEYWGDGGRYWCPMTLRLEN